MAVPRERGSSPGRRPTGSVGPVSDRDTVRPTFAPLRREKLSETVAQQLREQIRDGGLESGERIPGHRELADAFSVGLSSVREAISMLVSEGLIETRAGRGTFVRHRTDAMAIAAAGEVPDSA
jgi:DNA-binding FadR family transcriptional regulator